MAPLRQALEAQRQRPAQRHVGRRRREHDDGVGAVLVHAQPPRYFAAAVGRGEGRLALLAQPRAAVVDAAEAQPPHERPRRLVAEAGRRRLLRRRRRGRRRPRRRPRYVRRVVQVSTSGAAGAGLLGAVLLTPDLRARPEPLADSVLLRGHLFAVYRIAGRAGQPTNSARKRCTTYKLPGFGYYTARGMSARVFVNYEHASISSSIIITITNKMTGIRAAAFDLARASLFTNEPRPRAGDALGTQG